MAKVAICTPHSNIAYPDYYRSFFTMQHSFPQHSFIFAEIDMQIVGKARNVIVDAVLASGVDVSFWVDDDVMIPPNAGVLIDQALQYGIISGLYFNRHMPHTPQLYKLATEPAYKGRKVYWPVTEYTEGLMPVDAVGFGCVAVDVKVFHKLRELAETENKKREHDIAVIRAFLPDALKEDFDAVAEKWPMSPWFEFTDAKGEDMYFCELAVRAGYQVWANTQVKCGHLKMVPVEEYHFKDLVSRGLAKVVEAAK